MIPTISVHADLKALSAGLDGLARRQIPFATALAITETARAVASAETAQLTTSFQTPTPFTLRATGVIPARKETLTARVFVKDRQALYLAPAAFGGRQFLGAKRAILTPRDVALNAYGNIPKGRLSALKGRPDIFIGEVKTRAGKTIGGVWQRPSNVSVGGKKVRGLRLNRTGHLRLLIQFTTPAEVTHRLPYEARARQTIASALPAAWSRALARALATAK